MRCLSGGWGAICFACFAASLGCDPRANATGTESIAAAQSGRLSAIHESCAATADCEGDLRCVQGTCRPPASSIQGEYYAAVGRRAIAEERTSDATAAFQKAVAEYRAVDLEPPAELSCSLGTALTAVRQDRELAEEAARHLHHCVLSLPPGNAQRDRALDQLAVLADDGLDPVHLARSEASERYLTREPVRPPIDNLQIQITEDEKPPRYSEYAAIKKLLESPEVEALLTSCWKSHWEATKETTMKVVLPLAHSFRLDQFEDFDKSFIRFEGELPADPAAAQAATCVRTQVGPLVDEIARKQRAERRWEAMFTITVSVGS